MSKLGFVPRFSGLVDNTPVWIGSEEGPDRGFVLIGERGVVAAFNALAVVGKLAGAASDVGNIEHGIPLQPLVDCEVVGIGERLAIVARIEARL